MTTRKILIIALSVVIGLGLIVAIFVGGIIGIAMFSVSRSEAAETAKTFLRNDKRLKQDIGEIKDFGSFVTGNVNIDNGNGNATINLKVEGERKTVNASVDLMYRNGRQWRVTAASYQNDAGETIELLNPDESRYLIRRLLSLI